jgi:K+-sensing histidine kinase KdpD
MAKILVIEDASELRNDILEMLSLEGYETLGAANGYIGVDIAFNEPPDLIVCDVMMPELDGYGVLERVRSNPLTSTIPFIFLTSKTEHSSVRQGMTLGADDYLTKPFMVSELLDTIRTQLKKKEDQARDTRQHMDKLRENIITALPHELRTPLNTVLGFSEMLINEADNIPPEQVREWGQHILSAGQRLLRMTENYLSYTRSNVVLRSPEMLDKYRQERLYNVRAIVEGQAERTAERYRRTGDMVSAVEEAHHVIIAQADLMKIVDELLDNAFKFSMPGTPVRLTGRPEAERYLLTIEDEGRGIDAVNIQNIGAYMQFDRWFYEQQGMGLGLAIVDQLVRLYDGIFTIQATGLPGTRAVVQLRISSG